jgi:uncharacterized protein
MPVTALYAALLAPLLILLSVRVIRLRRSVLVALGDGGDATLQRAMRVHANFVEYAPFALVLLALAESLTSPQWLLHAAGILLLSARFAHAYGVSQTHEQFVFRVTGMALTFTTIGLLAVVCMYGSISILIQH